MIICKNGINRRGNQGFVLFMSLVVLLLLTVLGMSSLQTISLQQRMARNAGDAGLAFQAAESALRDGEDYLETLHSLDKFSPASARNDGFYYEAAPGGEPNWVALDWSGSRGFRFGETRITGVAGQPKYILEHIKTIVPNIDRLDPGSSDEDANPGHILIFRVTAHGTGRSRIARVMVQSIYGRHLFTDADAALGDYRGRLAWKRLDAVP